MTRQGVAPDVALLAVVLIWGTNIPVVKSALGDLHPLAFNAARLTLSTAVLALLDARERWRRARRPVVAAGPPPSRWRIVALALLGSFVYQVLFLIGMARTTAGNTGLIVGTVPVWTAALAWLLGAERLRSLAWLGLLLAFGGAAVIAAEGGDLQMLRANLTGNLLVLAAMLCWGLFTVLSRPVLLAVSPVRFAYLTSALALPGHLLIALPHFGPVVDGEVPARVWWCAVYSGVLSTGVAYPLWNFGVQRLGASHTAIYNNLVPLVALAVSFAWLGEAITTAQVVGGAAILTGLVVMRRTRAPA